LTLFIVSSSFFQGSRRRFDGRGRFARPVRSKARAREMPASSRHNRLKCLGYRVVIHTLARQLLPMIRPGRQNLPPRAAHSAARTGKDGRADQGPARHCDYRNSDIRTDDDWLAIDSAWTPSCCLVCRAWSFALSFARSASTRFPIPASTESCSFVMKFRCEPSDLEPVPSLGSAPETLAIATLTMVIMPAA